MVQAVCIVPNNIGDFVEFDQQCTKQYLLLVVAKLFEVQFSY